MALTKPFNAYQDWIGKTVVVVCSGPSLTVAQLRLIARARHAAGDKIRVIAVNDAIYGAFWADWLHSSDWSWWSEHIQGVHTFDGIRSTLADDVPDVWVDGHLTHTGDSGYDPDPGNIRGGNNSGYQAIHLAITCGAARIVLVGMDMQPGLRGETHYFGEHRDGRKPNFAHVMLPHFKTLIPTLEERGIELVNATPGSAITDFPMVDLEETLLRALHPVK